MAGYPELREAIVEHDQVEELVQTDEMGENRMYAIIKRFIDISVAIALFVLFLPLIARWWTARRT